MAFESLLGNARLKQNLTRSLAQGHISHFYLISGPRGSGKHTLARLLAAAILCRNSSRPCLQCPACRRVLAGNHPDCITVEDPEHKTTAVKIVRQFREDVFIRPNESDHKIYIFPQELGLEGQNALLKILEEPPKYGVFLLLTDNPDKLLPTVRSRCTQLKLLPLPEERLLQQLQQEFPGSDPEDLRSAALRSGGYLGQAREILSQGPQLNPQTESFLQAFARGDILAMTQALVPMEKWKRDALQETLQVWTELLEAALSYRLSGLSVPKVSRELAGVRSSADLMAAIRILKQAREYTAANVSPAAVCGWLQWKLK